MRVMRRMVFFLGLAVALMLSGFRGWPQAPSREEPAVTRAIEIDLPSGGAWPVAAGADHAVFYVPVVGKGEMLGIIAVSKGHFVGVRIRPSIGEDKDSVKIEVAALVTAKKTLSEANCNDVRSWQSEDAGSYEAKKDESLVLSGLSRLGLPVFKVKVIGSSGLRPPEGGNRIFCGCESTRDELNDFLGVGTAPEPGKCVEIGKCARCCRVVTQAPSGTFGKLSNPLPISPVNGAAMKGYPRTVTFQWSEVPGATQYGIEIDCYGCCAAHDWCTNVGKPGFIADSLKQPTYIFDFWGDQPGRWRVWAIGPHWNASEKSQWSEFTFGKLIEGKLIPPVIPPAALAQVIACNPSTQRSMPEPGIIPPKPTYNPEPEYSDAARRDKLNGSVELGVDIGEDGRVRAVCVARPLRADLDAQAVGAVKTWRFEPARKEGVAIPWYAIVYVAFALR